MMENIPSIFSFPATVFGRMEKYNAVISKARVRIFYKGLNRNSTYITDEFAEKLLSTLSYTPICGIYDIEEKDFKDHGKTRDLGKAYGVIPENHNLKWEKHLDEDGVEREYACADVLLWTARYKEANDIINKGQSMELYTNSIKGEWKYVDGKKIYEFTDACFIGLAPLGDNIEPCFEGASFYSIAESLQEMVKELQDYNLNNSKGGKDEMMLNFKLSDNEKACAIFQLLNPNYNEEGHYEIDYSIIDIYDEYAFVYNYEEGKYYRVLYTKDDEKNEIVLGEKEERIILDVSIEEYNSLKNLRTLNGETFEKVEEAFNLKDNTITELNETIADNALKINEKDEAISSLEASKAELEAEKTTLYTTISEKEAENENLSTKIEELNCSISTLTQEKETLENYKLGKERAEKKVLIAKYSSKLDSEVINEFNNSVDNYSYNDLNKELAAKFVEATPSLFNNEGFEMIPNGREDLEKLSPAAQLLKKHRKNSSKE